VNLIETIFEWEYTGDVCIVREKVLNLGVFWDNFGFVSSVHFII
jgi:hypothetical protein